MTVFTMNNRDGFVATSAAIFQQYGVTLEIGYDFETYRDILKEARPDHVLGAPYDPEIHDLDRNTGLWIVGRKQDGQVVHTQALRLIDMAKQSMAQYFLGHFRDFPPSGVDIDLKRSRYKAGPMAKRSYGRMAYHGEFWIGSGHADLRGRGLSCVLGRYGFCQALDHWDPDHITAFMAKSTAFKGLAERTGWMHTQPGALRWFLRGHDEPIEGFMAYMDREDLHYILELPLNELVSLAA